MNFFISLFRVSGFFLLFNGLSFLSNNFLILVANLLSDFLLVFSPLYVLRRLRLPENQRRLIFSCLMGSALVSLACIVTTVFQFVPTSWEPTVEIRVIIGYLEVSCYFTKMQNVSFNFFSLFKGSVSLFVCNLLVIVTYFYQIFRQRDLEERDVEETPTTHNSSQEMYETDRTSQHPTPLGSEDYTTSNNLTEISGAYFTDPISTFDEGDSNINSEQLQATVAS